MWPPRAPRASTQRKISALCWYLLRPQPSRMEAGLVVAYSRASLRVAGSGSSPVAAPTQPGAACADVGGVVPGADAEVGRLARPRRAAEERAAGGGGPAEQVPEAAAQELGGAPRAGALVVHDRERAVLGHVAADLLRDEVERLVPADAHPAPVGAAGLALERMELPL